LEADQIKRCIGVPGDTFYIDNGFNKIKNVSDTLGNYFAQQILSEKVDTEIEAIIFNCFILFVSSCDNGTFIQK
jgi:hypothetical protein